MKNFAILLLFILTTSCSKDVLRTSTLNEKSLDLQVKEAYLDGLEALEAGDVFFCC